MIKKRHIFISMVCLILINVFMLSGIVVHGQDIEFTEEELKFIEEHQVVTIGVDPEFRPYEFIDTDNVYKGIAADYLKIIQEKSGLNFQLIEGYNWEDVYDLALEGKVDMLPCVGKTSQREAYFILTDTYLQFQRVIFSKDQGPVYAFEKLKDIRVGVQKNSSHYSFLSEFDSIKPILYTTNDEMLLALSVGEIEAIVSNYASVTYRMKEIGLSGIKVDEIINEVKTEDGQVIQSNTNKLVMAVNKDLAPLASIINKVLSSITEEESIQIRNKWIGIEKAADYSDIIRLIVIAAIIVAIVITMFLVYSYLLRKEIANRKVVEEELLIAREHAEKANEAKSTFLAHMSHEIRTPLNAVTGLAFLLENTKTSQVQKKYIKNIKDASYNLLSIINDILDFSKIEAGEVEVEKIEFSLDHLLDKIGNLLMPKATAKGLSFHVKKDTRIGDRLISDPTRIEQVLINFVNNAIKFTHDGGINIEVLMEEETLEGYQIRFIVKDSGIGISKEQQKHLFTPFHQLDSSVTRKYGGTGLGLSISKNLVELLDGEISVISEEGVGSSFIFSIPVAVKRDLKDRKVYPDFSQERVLIFDEDIESAGIISDYLKSFNLESLRVNHYHEALSELSSGKYQILIMELNIAGVDSLEFIKTYASGLTVIFTAKQVLESQYEQAKEVGVKHILMKPIISSILYNALVQCLVKDFEEEVIEKKALRKGTEAEILLVEDNEVNQMIEKEILEQHGYHVTIAENGQVAVDYMNEDKKVDVILMDIHMPVMDGYEATTRIREKNKQVPILAMTAVSFSNIEKECLEVGMTGYVTKPVEPKKLFETLEKYIHSREHIQAKKHIVNKEITMKTKSIVERKKMMANSEFIDKKQGLMRIGNNEKLYHEVLQKFYDDTYTSVEVVNKLILNKDYEAAKKLVHKIKGTSGNIGAVYLFSSAKMLMEVLRQNLEIDLGPYIWEYESDLVNTLDTIKEILKEYHVEPEEVKDEKLVLSEEEEEKLRLLKDKLFESDIDAFRLYNEIQEIIKSYSKDWKLVKKHMDNYQFKEASRVLKQILGD